MPKQSDQPEQPGAKPAAEVQAAGPAGGKGLLSHWRPMVAGLLSTKGLAILLIASLVVHGFAFVYYRLGRQGPAAPEHEIGLGVFQFVPTDAQAGPIARAQFSLYVTLLEGFERTGRQRLAIHRSRVQQDIEQLLRQAHAGDFEDPCLTELKRRIQEQINQSLGVRAVSEVIITGLELKLCGLATRPEAQAAQAPAWLEEPAG